MSSPTVSVVISAFTVARWEQLLAAIRSVRQQRLVPQQIIVVVDNNQELFARVRREVTGVLALENHEHPGLSGARNSGVAHATGEIVAFLDDDAVAMPDWLDYLLTPYSDANVVGTGGSIEPSWAHPRPSWFPGEFNWVVGCTYPSLPTTAAPVRNVIGANMSFRRELLRSTGGFRRDIGRIGSRPLGCEETELCIRLRQRRPGSTLIYEPRARVRHLVPRSRSTMRYFLRRCYSEGRSKATVTRVVGSRDGLASERAYTLQALPRGVARGIGDALVRGDRSGLLRSGAIMAGLVTTTFGYGVSRAILMVPGPTKRPHPAAIIPDLSNGADDVAQCDVFDGEPIRSIPAS